MKTWKTGNFIGLFFENNSLQMMLLFLQTKFGLIFHVVDTFMHTIGWIFLIFFPSSINICRLFQYILLSMMMMIALNTRARKGGKERWEVKGENRQTWGKERNGATH